MSHKRHEIEALFAELYNCVPEWKPQQIHAASTPEFISGVQLGKTELHMRYLEELMEAHKHVQMLDEAHHIDMPRKFTPFGRSPLADMRHDLDVIFSLIHGPKLTFLAWSMERLHRDITIYKTPNVGPTQGVSIERLIELANGPRYKMPSGMAREQRREWARGIKS